MTCPPCRGGYHTPSTAPRQDRRQGPGAPQNTGGRAGWDPRVACLSPRSRDVQASGPGPGVGDAPTKGAGASLLARRQGAVDRGWRALAGFPVNLRVKAEPAPKAARTLAVALDPARNPPCRRHRLPPRPCSGPGGARNLTAAHARTIGSSTGYRFDPCAATRGSCRGRVIPWVAPPKWPWCVLSQ